MKTNAYISLDLTAVINAQVNNLQDLQTTLKSVQIQNLSHANCIQLSIKLAKIKGKLEAYTEVTNLVQANMQEVKQ